MHYSVCNLECAEYGVRRAACGVRCNFTVLDICMDMWVAEEHVVMLATHFAPDTDKRVGVAVNDAVRVIIVGAGSSTSTDNVVLCVPVYKTN